MLDANDAICDRFAPKFARDQGPERVVLPDDPGELGQGIVLRRRRRKLRLLQLPLDVVEVQDEALVRLSHGRSGPPFKRRNDPAAAGQQGSYYRISSGAVTPRTARPETSTHRTT